MPRENIIRKKAIDILESEGWITWHPSRAKYKQNDVFGVIDLLALKRKQRKNIQITTSPNASTRRKKILAFFKKFKVEMLIELWSWNKKQKKFKKEKIIIKLPKRA